MKKIIEQSSTLAEKKKKRKHQLSVKLDDAYADVIHLTFNQQYDQRN